MKTILLGGYLVRHPVAGNVWAQLPYLVGFARLGFDVWFVEDAGWEDSCFDPAARAHTSDPTSGLVVVAEALEPFGLSDRIAFRDLEGDWHGPARTTAPSLFPDADLYVDVGGTCNFAEAASARTRALVDMDPVFTQLGGFAHDRLRDFDHHFTYGLTLASNGSIPTGGIDWRPLPPPVLVDQWDDAPAAPGDGAWTTIANWNAYGTVEHEGETFGQKDVEFRRFIELPRLAPTTLELALSGREVPGAELQANGWRVRDALEVSATPSSYRDYIWGSRGEWSVAKEAYVKAGSGWFSDRTASYLASGRPAVVQDTGASTTLPIGEGILTFTTPEEAATALATVERDYERHSVAASEFAAKHLSYEMVLGRLLDRAGLS